MRTRIHVNQHHIKANAKGAELPVLTIKDWKENRKGNLAMIMDHRGHEIARVIYRPWQPLPCGAKCWIETQLEVRVE